MSRDQPALPAPKRAVGAAVKKFAARLALWPALAVSACLALPGLVLLAAAAALWLAADTLAKQLEV